MHTRRALLKQGAMVAFGAGTVPAWLSQAAYAGNSGGKKVLVVIFQRGAMDGLNVVAPFGDPNYTSLRPTLGLASPAGRGEGALIDLDGFYGLHPALAMLKPLWDGRQLAMVHSTGSPDATRSHFDAQDYMESGTPGRKSTRDGWLNRALLPDADTSPVRAVSMGSSLARTLRGPNAAVAVSNIGNFKVRDHAADPFLSMYAGSLDKELRGTGKETFDAVKLLESINKQPYTPGGGASYPNGRLGQAMQQIARLIKAGVGLEVAFADSTGWDTHVNQGPQLNNLLRDFGQSLAAFHADMGDRMADVTVVTMSEFGRTARENGTRGTDHGHGNVMFALGGGVNGGKVYGRWPGLAPEQLNEGRDLAVTTDFRDVLSACLKLQMENIDLAKVFPEYQARLSAVKGLLSAG